VKNFAGGLIVPSDLPDGENIKGFYYDGWLSQLKNIKIFRVA
jgi:hypothetical protein